MHTKKLTAAEAMQELQSARHDISTELAGNMIKHYQKFRKQLQVARKTKLLPKSTPSFPTCLTYNKAAIYQLMKAPGCTGIRFYFAMNSKQQLTLVIVGVDENGENILPLKIRGTQLLAKGLEMEGSTGLLDEGQASPPYPVPGGL